MTTTAVDVSSWPTWQVYASLQWPMTVWWLLSLIRAAGRGDLPEDP